MRYSKKEGHGVYQWEQKGELRSIKKKGKALFFAARRRKVHKVRNSFVGEGKRLFPDNNGEMERPSWKR